MSQKNSYEIMKKEYIANEIAENIKSVMNEDKMEAFNLVKELMRVYPSGIFCHYSDNEIYKCTQEIVKIYFSKLRNNEILYIPTICDYFNVKDEDTNWNSASWCSFRQCIIEKKGTNLALDEISMYRHKFYYQNNEQHNLFFTNELKYLNLTLEIIEDISKINKYNWTYECKSLNGNVIIKLLLLFTKNIYVNKILVHEIQTRERYQKMTSYDVNRSVDHGKRCLEKIKSFNTKRFLCFAVITLYQVYFSYFKKLDLCPYVIFNIISQIKYKTFIERYKFKKVVCGGKIYEQLTNETEKVLIDIPDLMYIELDKIKTLEQIKKIRDTMKLIYQNKQICEG